MFCIYRLLGWFCLLFYQNRLAKFSTLWALTSRRNFGHWSKNIPFRAPNSLAAQPRPLKEPYVTQFSVLDLVPVREGSSLADAFAASVELAQKAEELGCARFWVAEHHAMEGIAGGATSVVLAHIGNATNTIRIGLFLK